MQVKIGNQIYNSNDVPIILILDYEDIKNISNMPMNLLGQTSSQYNVYPKKIKEE